MLKQLRRRLTLICAAVSGAILLAMALSALTITHQQWNQRNQADFMRAAQAIRLRLTTEMVLTNSWLSQNEVAQRMVILIEDNAQPLLWRGAWTPQTPRNELSTLAKQQALELGLDVSLLSSSILLKKGEDQVLTFDMKGEAGERYRAYVNQLSRDGQWLTLIILQETAQQDAQLSRMYWGFIGAAAAGMVMLGIFSWWFAGRAIHPVEQAQQRQNRFVADASHELRSPLAVIRLSAQAMAQADKNEADAFCLTIEKEATHMSRLVEDLLLLAHADSGRWQMQRSPLEPQGVLQQAFGVNQMLAQRSDQQLTLNAPSQLPLIAGDEGYLIQSLNILLQNAMDHTPAGGSIVLAAMPIPGGVRISVANNGPAIEEQHLPHLFDRFYRASKDRKRDGHYGLGLSIAKAIVQAHGGQIRAHNLPQGGCVFEVDLPAAKG